MYKPGQLPQNHQNGQKGADAGKGKVPVQWWASPGSLGILSSFYTRPSIDRMHWGTAIIPQMV